MNNFIKKGFFPVENTRQAEKRLVNKGYTPAKLSDPLYLIEFHLLEDDNIIKIARVRASTDGYIVQYFIPESTK